VSTLTPDPAPQTGARSLAGRTVLLSGGTRGIGLAIAVRAAADGANVVLLGKTDQPHPKLPGTLHTAAAQVEAAGGLALPVVCDIRFDDQVLAAVEQAVAAFGGIDVLVNNASAISPTPTLDTEMKRFDLMHQVNVRGTFMVTKAALPHLLQAPNPHVLTLSPPLDLDPKWYAPHLAYTMSKMAMSMVTLGLAAEFASQGIAVSSLWPLASVDTAAVRNVLGGDGMAATSRTTDIVADAAHAILTRPAGEATGNFYIDEEVLREEGTTDFTRYAPHASGPLTLDFFVPDATAARSRTTVTSWY
jgi:citronellol/citronellal dehydrogenase